MAQAKSTYFTPQEYLAWDRKQQETHEYHNGVIVSMSGGTLTHAIIIGNLSFLIPGKLDRRRCITVSGNLRVWVKECNQYFYPDVAVVCGEPHLIDAHNDTIDNPNFVVEVLSDSTGRFDLTTKSDCYYALTSVHTYLLVSQDEARIERRTRIQGKDSWEVTVYLGADAVVQLPEFECELRASEVYERVEFNPAVG